MELKENYAQIAARNAEVLPVTTDDLERAAPAVEAFSPPFPMPYDVSADVPRQWGRFDNFGTGLADAAVFIIDRNGELAWQDLGEDYRHQVAASGVNGDEDKPAEEGGRGAAGATRKKSVGNI